MKVLITGCAGFIGSNLTDYCLDRECAVVGIDNFDPFYSKEQKLSNLASAFKNENFSFFEIDIRNRNELNTLPEGIDMVIHLAAKAGVRPSILSPNAYVDTNITGTLNILEWMRDRNMRKMVFGSSSSIYGNNKKIPFSEDDNVNEPISPYAFTKKACELLTYTYHHLYNIDIVNLRFFTVYGPRQRPDLAIRKFVEAIIKGEPIHMFGDGNTGRDYTYVDDILSGIAGAMKLLTTHDKTYEIVNLGNNKPVKLIELVSAIGEVLQKKPDIIFEPMQQGDVENTCADISKAIKLIQYNPSISLNDGLKNFVNWLKEAKTEL